MSLTNQLRLKWTFRAHGQSLVFVKRPDELAEHVIMKALLWALYLPSYPDVAVEIPIGDRYKPDLVQLDESGNPDFWAEAGDIRKAKIRSLVRRYRETHFAMGKWNTNLEPFIQIVSDAVVGIRRAAPFDIIHFPEDSAERFLKQSGTIRISFDDIDWIRLSADEPPKQGNAAEEAGNERPRGEIQAEGDC
jgi:hypothetical protein